MIVFSKSASVTARGRSSRIGRPHWPHLGPSESRARSTRLAVPQNTHFTTTGRLVCVAFAIVSTSFASSGWLATSVKLTEKAGAKRR